MSIRRILQWSMFLFVASAILCAAADAGSLSGIVRDGEGKPLAGVRIALTGSQTPPSTNQAVSGPTGEYRIAGLAAGEYTLSGELGGYVSPAPQVVRIPPTSVPVTADLTLTRSAVTLGQRPAALHPQLEFQSAGIRGLIDPGGYSASTAGAATGLLRGIADVKRTDKSFSIEAAKNWPCSLEAELRKAADEHPDRAETNRRLGQFYAAHEQPAKAIPLLKRALEIDGADYAASRALAVAWLESGEFDEARKLLTALAEGRAEPEVHQLLARAEEGSGMFRQAALEYRVAESEEASEESLFGIGYELVLAGSVAEGAAAFEAGVQRYPGSIPLRIGAGAAQFFLGRTGDSLRSFLDAAEIDPSDPRPYSFMASVSATSSVENERALNSFKRYFERKSDSAPANYYYALALERENPPADAGRIEKLLKRAVQLDPNLARAHLHLADLYAQRGDDRDAVSEYEAAVRLDQNLGEAHYRLAMAYKHTGKADLAAREMQVFQLSKQRQTTGSDRIELAQFISVMDAEDSRSSQETQCPVLPR
jgi:tetratricopeptide (TPR) repeat protein